MARTYRTHKGTHMGTLYSFYTWLFGGMIISFAFVDFMKSKNFAKRKNELVSQRTDGQTVGRVNDEIDDKTEKTISRSNKTLYFQFAFWLWNRMNKTRNKHESRIATPDWCSHLSHDIIPINSILSVMVVLHNSSSKLFLCVRFVEKLTLCVVFVLEWKVELENVSTEKYLKIIPPLEFLLSMYQYVVHWSEKLAYLDVDFLLSTKFI